MTRGDYLMFGLLALVILVLVAMILHAVNTAKLSSYVSACHGGRERRVDVPDGYRFAGIFSDGSDGTFNVYVEYEKDVER